LIRLHAATTTNGRKAAIALEELELEYELSIVDLEAGEQNRPAFVALNPNSKTPVLEVGGTVIWESGAILLYLGENLDPEHRILPERHDRRWEAIQYSFFQACGIGPNLGRLVDQLRRPEPQRNQEMVELFSNEVDRLFGVLEAVLADGRPYLAGDYSIADIMHHPWLQPALALGAPQLTSRPRLVEWLTRIDARPAVRRGVAALA
jgi:glutathione S-transferase